MGFHTLASIFLFLFWVISVSDSTQLFAQEQSTYRFHDIVVTGTKTPKFLEDTPIRTEVIRSKELRESHVKDLKEALELNAGASFAPIRGVEGSSVSFQGLQDDQTLIVIDDVPQNTSFLAVDIEQFNISELDRIEIVKGASSALYGSSAIGGVVHLITKKPKKKFEYTFLQEIGSNSTLTRARLASKSKYWSVQLGGHFQKLFHSDFDPSTLVKDGIEGNNFSIQPKLFYQPSENTTVELGFSQNLNHWNSELADTDIGGTEVYFNRNRYLRNQANASIRHQLSPNTDLKLILSGEIFNSRQNSKDRVATDFEDSIKEGTLETLRAELQVNQSLGEKNILTMGAVGNFQRLDILTTDQLFLGEFEKRKDVDLKNSKGIELYAQDDWIIGNTEWIPGIRFQHDPGFGNFVAPKLSFQYSPKIIKNAKTHFRASIGRGYKIPSLIERYYLLDHTSIAGYQVKGNQNLKPESSLSLQAGPEILWNQNSISLNGFYHDVQNLIEYKKLGFQSGLQTFEFQNISRTNSYGLETSISAQVHPRLSTRLAYTYSVSKNIETNKELPYHPNHSLTSTVKFNFNKKGSSLALQLRFQGREFAGDINEGLEISRSWMKTDIKLNHYLKKNMLMFLGINNLFDVHRAGREDFVGTRFDRRPAQGRFFYLGLELRES